MDEELERRFDGLMERINNNHEQVLERFHSIDRQLNAVGAALTSVNGTLQTVVMLLSSFDKRITNLEDKP